MLAKLYFHMANNEKATIN